MMSRFLSPRDSFLIYFELHREGDPFIYDLGCSTMDFIAIGLLPPRDSLLIYLERRRDGGPFIYDLGCSTTGCIASGFWSRSPFYSEFFKFSFLGKTLEHLELFLISQGTATEIGRYKQTAIRHLWPGKFTKKVSFGGRH